MESVALRSIEDLRRYSLALASRNVADDPVVRALQSARQLTWFGMLCGSFLCYHLMDKLLEALLMLK
jgi:hypothetical protein